MNRITSIVLIIIVVVLLGLGVWWWLTQKEEPAANANQTTNQNVNAVTVLEGGSLVVEKQTLYQSTTLELTTALEDTTFHEVKAEDGQKHFIVFFSPLTPNEEGSLPGWLNTDVSLTTGDGQTYSVWEVKAVAKGTTAVGDQGYFWYQVPEAAQDYSLKFGQGDDALMVDLGV